MPVLSPQNKLTLIVAYLKKDYGLLMYRVCGEKEPTKPVFNI